MTDRQTLIDMGFAPNRVDQALRAVKNAGLQPAMDHLIAHADDPEGDICEPPSHTLAEAAAGASKSGDGTETVDDEEGEIQNGQQTAQSLQCNDCQRFFRDAAAAERHAIKTSHVNFSESTTAIKPLTEAEKKEKLAELKARLAEKRSTRSAEDIAERKTAERLRRKAGQDMTDVKAKMEEKEMQKVLEQKIREKLEDAKAKAAIKAKIAQDKAERSARKNADSAKTADAARLAEQDAAAAKAAEKAAAVVKEYTDARLQIRKPDGSTFTQVFKAEDPLSAVYDFVREQYNGDFKLTTTFPRKVLAGPEMKKTLKELMLVPSAALVMST